MPRIYRFPLMLVFTFAAGGCGDDSSASANASASSTETEGSFATGETTGTSGTTGTTGDSSQTSSPESTSTATTGDSDSTATDTATDTGPGTGTDTDTDTGDRFAPELYTADRVHSPITPYVAASIAAIAQAAPRRDDAFSKLGASSTVSPNFLHCFKNNDKIDLFGRDYLWDTIDTFRAEVGQTTSFDRTSLCATIGWSAVTAVKGDPSPLQAEVDAADPRFALVMYGTNDINLGSVLNYGHSMVTLVDTLTEQGVIPILMTIMPRDDNPDADAQVPIYNAVIRAIAQSRQLPFVDYHRQLVDLEDHGLSGDGIHRAASKSGACVLTPEALNFGANVRNLLSLEALDRARITLGGVDQLDPPMHQLAGAGLPEDPYVIPALPFGDRRDTTVDGVSQIDTYPGCNAEQDESGREVYYRLEIEETTTVRAIILDRGDVDIDLHLVDATASGAGCIARDNASLTVELAPGTYFFVLDTYVSQGIGTAGDYLFVIEREPV